MNHGFKPGKRVLTTRSIPRPLIPAPIGFEPSTIAAQVGVGIACASFWRGLWYYLDDNLFPQNPLHSSLASLGMGTTGLALSQGLMAKMAQREIANQKIHLPGKYSTVARFATLYGVSISCVLVWRGAWMMWDVGYEKWHKDKEAKATDPGHLTNSGLLSHFVAVGGLLAFGRFASVLAPPARVSILKDLTFKANTWRQYASAAKWFFK